MAKRIRVGGRRRVASVKTMGENISHIRKMLKRLDETKLEIPKSGKEFKIRRQGSRLIVDGKVFKPSDLDALKGQKVEFGIHAKAWLEDQLKKEEYRRIKSTSKTYKITGLSKLEVEHALAGYDYISEDEKGEFVDWLNSDASGSDGYKKNHFYHVFGANQVDGGTIRSFLIYMDSKNVKELWEKHG